MTDLPRLYGVTDDHLLPGDRVVVAVRAAVEAGLRLVQVRWKTAPEDERLRVGRELRAITRDHGALLIVNDRPDLAAELMADGTHVGATDPAAERARALLGPDAIVGVSAYADPERVRDATDLGADYVGLSSPYPSLTKEKAIPAPEAFRELAAACPLPAYAIGGLTPDRAAAMLRTGVHGVAAIRALLAVPDPAAATRAFLRVVDAATTDRPEGR